MVVVVVVCVCVVVFVGLFVCCVFFVVTPLGSPDTANETGCVAPETRVAVTKVEVEAPCTTDFAPPFEIEKSNAGGGGVTVPEVSE